MCCVYHVLRILLYHHACLCMCSKLLVGSEDFDIRVFKEDKLVSEMTENEVKKEKRSWFTNVVK